MRSVGVHQDAGASRHPCPNCRRSLVEISLPTAIGRMVMRSCTPCDYRSWYEASSVGGEVIALSSVLAGLAPSRPDERDAVDEAVAS
jgi:hypothetical protein